MHIERLGTTPVEGIELGMCLVFSKIDGTNSSCYLNDSGEVTCGSRNRELTEGLDNSKFKEYILKDERISNYLTKYPKHRLYGEWLVSHSLKTYRDEAWRKFYIFDITIDIDEDNVEYIPYNIYKPWLEEFNLEFIPPLCAIKNGNFEQFVKQLENNTFLIKDGMGTGEGIVIKNYDYKNHFGRTVWAKIVRAEFKEMNRMAFGHNVLNNKIVEDSIADEFCTNAIIEKTYAKIVNECGGWESKFIPRLIDSVYYDVINEECWNFVKKHKNPKINFKTLKGFITAKIKIVKSEIFN